MIINIDESERQKTEKIQITHEQIAQLISSVRETVSRVLKRWEQQGILQLYRGYIHILHFKYLHTLTEDIINLGFYVVGLLYTLYTLTTNFPVLPK